MCRSGRDLVLEWSQVLSTYVDIIATTRKDLAICLEEARRNGAQLPVAALVDQFYAGVEKLGGRRWDTSSLITLLKR